MPFARCVSQTSAAGEPAAALFVRKTAPDRHLTPAHAVAHATGPDWPQWRARLPRTFWAVSTVRLVTCLRCAGRRAPVMARQADGDAASAGRGDGTGRGRTRHAHALQGLISTPPLTRTRACTDAGGGFPAGGGGRGQRATPGCKARQARPGLASPGQLARGVEWVSRYHTYVSPVLFCGCGDSECALHARMCSLTIECVLLLENVFSY